MVITIERSGQVPLCFEGTLLGSGDASVGKRRYQASLYKTSRGEFVLAFEFSSSWERELRHRAAIVASTVDDLQSQLSALQPIHAGVGYPIGEQYAAKQERLIAELTAAFGEAISAAFRTGGVVQEI